MGGSVALIAVWPRVAITIPLLLLANVGRSLFDVSGRTLLQRTGSPAVLGRIFGVIESVDMLGLSLGSLVVPILIGLGGTKAAIVGVGAIMPLVTLVLLPAILRADARATVPIVQIGLLRAMALFRLLPPPQMEGVARMLEPRQAAAGEVLIREGEAGDLFYLVADGEAGRRPPRAGFATTISAGGEGFGEIALLNDTPRTATVTASSDASLYTLGREEFLTAITGMADVHGAARTLASERLAQQTAI